VKPAPFEYLRPATLEEAVRALAEHPHAKVLAGGQSLIPLLSMRLAAPEVLVDINGLTELAYVSTDDDGVRVGALARHAQVERDADAARVQPLVAEALRLVAHPTIRNRGTTVGSIVHADAAAEMPMVLALLGGHVTAASVRGTRQVPARDLFAGPLETSLGSDEIATEAFFPALAARAGAAFDELSRRHGDYALVGVGAVVELDGRGVDRAVAGYLSVDDVPLVLDVTEAFVTAGARGSGSDAGSASGSGGFERAYRAAAGLARGRVDPPSDIHATADYRRHLAGVLTERVLRRAHAAAADRCEAAA
jgi:CO/xanthine dehydrogenase FAD-binding subunit